MRQRAASKNGPPVHLRFRANTDVLMDLTVRVSVQSPCPLYPKSGQTPVREMRFSLIQINAPTLTLILLICFNPINSFEFLV
jgi:hypothetical protein